MLALLGSSGCARQEAASGRVSESRADIALVVQNPHWSDVIVYLLHDGVVDRMGLATAVKTSTFIIPRRRLGPAGLIRLRDHPVGAPDDYTAEAFLVRPGQEIASRCTNQGQRFGSFQFCSGPPSGMLVFAFRSLSG